MANPNELGFTHPQSSESRGANRWLRGRGSESFPAIRTTTDDVTDELHAGPVRGEIPLHEVRDRCRGFGIRFGGDPERARLTWDQSLLPHDLTHQLG